MENFSEEFKKPFKFSFGLLRYAGVDYFGKRSVRNYLVLVCLFVFVPLHYIASSAYIIKVSRSGIELYELAYFIPPFNVVNQGLLKFFVLANKKSKTEEIIKQLGNMRHESSLRHSHNINKSLVLKKINKFNSVFYYINLIGTVQYCVTPLLQTLLCILFENQCKMLLPFAGSYPLEPTESWTVYMLIYLHQCYSVVSVIFAYLGAELLLITLCGYLSLELMLLQEDLLNVKVKKDDDENHGLRDIIQKHQVLISLTNDVNDVFTVIIFADLLFASITICLFGFVAKFARGPWDKLNNFVGVVASILPIFNLCYFAQLVTDASTDIAIAAYNNIWYKADSSYRKSISIIITKSQQPCYLKSLGYAQVTLNTFSKVKFLYLLVYLLMILLPNILNAKLCDAVWIYGCLLINQVLSTTWSYFSLANSVYEENS